VLVTHFESPCPKMTALGDSLFVPRFALHPWRYADISLARCRLRTPPSNGLTACRSTGKDVGTIGTVCC
jgi:hypothetical protein